jgi:hypothetical protein
MTCMIFMNIVKLHGAVLNLSHVVIMKFHSTTYVCLPKVDHAFTQVTLFYHIFHLYLKVEIIIHIIVSINNKRIN